MGMEGEPADLPEGWRGRFLDGCDFDESFEELEGIETAEAVGLKARIRSLECRWSEADRLIRRATELAFEESGVPTKEQVATACFNHAYDRENRILWTGEGRRVETSYWRVVKDGTAQRILDAYLALDAADMAAAGDWEDARAVCDDWLRENQGRETGSLFWHLASGVSNLTLGEEEEGVRQLEIAGLHVQTGGAKLTRLRGACKLCQAWRAFGRRREASEWLAFVRGLRVPRKAVETILERSGRFGRLGKLQLA